MSHNIQYSTYPEKVNKESVQTEWDDYVAHEDWQEGASGLDKPIRWINKIFPDYESAEKYIEEIDNGWYDQLAVKYRSYKELKPTKTSIVLQERYQNAVKRRNELKDTFHFANVKSSYIGCKTCGSKISNKYLHKNTCPVCHNDMRPETTLKAITKAEENVVQLLKQINEEKQKQQKRLEKQAEIRWLVKIEYHT